MAEGQPAGKLAAIGFVSERVLPPRYLDALREGLAERGWIEGRGFRIEPRSADVVELIGLGVTLIVTGIGTPVALAAKRATAKIPIVFVTGRAHGSAASALLTAPTFWLLLVTTCGVAWPWLLLRKVPLRVERASSHLAILHLDQQGTPPVGTTRAISRTPLYGSYSASPDSASAFTIVVAVPGVTPSVAATYPIDTSRAPAGNATCPW